MVRVSVIVPVYKVEAYIEKCLKSLINQTLKDIEIILVNDGSPDNSQKIIDKYKRKYHKKIISIKKANGGQSSARNLGLKYATGEYISFVDSDDYVNVTMLEKMYNLAKKTDKDIILCGMKYCYNKRTEEVLLFNKTRDIKQNEYIVSPPAPWNKIYKRDFLTKNNFKFREGIIYEDLAIIPTLGIYTNSIAYLNECLYFYVQHEISTMNIEKYTPKINDIFVALDDLYNVFKDNNVLDKYYNELEQIFINHLLASGCYRFIKYVESKDCIKKSADIMKQRFPKWYKNKFLNNFTFKERLVMRLFYYRQTWIVLLITRLKSMVKSNDKS